jgi:anti-sigma28 factor (negative regulator of flagellin synthesis)
MRRKGGEKERMRNERNRRVAGGPETTREEGNGGAQAEAGTRGCERNQFSREQSATQHAWLDRARASRLAAQATPPEIRGERVAAIQSAIADGSYLVSPEQTADAIISEQQVRDGTAA